jgi:hypothetical protein
MYEFTQHWERTMAELETERDAATVIVHQLAEALQVMGGPHTKKLWQKTALEVYEAWKNKGRGDT